MQTPKFKFRQSSIISEKPGYLSEKLKTLTTSNYLLESLIFFAEILHTFPTCKFLQKRVRQFFYFV